MDNRVQLEYITCNFETDSNFEGKISNTCK